MPQIGLSTTAHSWVTSLDERGDRWTEC